MKFQVRYDPKAEEQLEKLPKEVSKRIVKRMRFVGETGRGIESIKDEKYKYKVRAGDYRVLIDITYDPNTIWVRVIGHRGKVYKKL